MSDTLKPTKISREGVILIKSFEGFRPRAIQRADGRWTIGYGHTQSAREGLTVSESDAELLLQYDLIPVAKAVQAVETPLNQHQFDALASFAFSVGVDRFETSDVRDRLNAGAVDEAAEALAAWSDDSAIASPPRRRAAERALFFADPQGPVSLADLLAVPLPPPTAVAVLSTSAPEPSTEAADFSPEDVAPFPSMDAPSAVEDAAVAEIETTDAVEVEPIEQAGADATPEAEAEAVEIAEPGPAAPIPAPVAASAAAFYSPYALRAVGPLPGFANATPDVAAVVANDTAVPAEEEAQPEVEAEVPTEEPTETEIAPAEVVTEAVEAPVEAVLDTSVAEDDAAVEAVEDAAPIAALETVETPVLEPFVELPEQPVQMPVFAAPASVDQTPTLELTEAPGLVETPAHHRMAWPDSHGFAHVDQTPLFDADYVAASETESEIEAQQPPRRLDWSETLTFIVMGCIGMLSFGAAMAAFRQAGQSGAGETTLIGWVLALIALACVGVSGYNLYQRWGRADRP